MPYETDNRLRSYLNTNQEKREQMCMALLSLDRRFTQLRPRHPRGGPDGGRDIEGRFNESLLAFGAVGFQNNANDSAPDKTAAKNKFADDLASALACDPRPQVFAFFTNVELTVGEREELIASAKKSGIDECIIYHREQMRHLLDSTNGLAIRFQYLDIRLSDEEQASFFQTWGGDIQSLISSRIGDIDTMLSRILFLQESTLPLQKITILFTLDRTYTAEEIKHFRIFCLIFFKAKLGSVQSVIFGAGDRSDRFVEAEDRKEHRPEQPGIGNSIGTGQWECTISQDDNDEQNVKSEYHRTGGSYGIGRKSIDRFSIAYEKEAPFLHFGERVPFRDIDEAMIMPMMDLSMAERISEFSLYANEYELLRITKSELRIDSTHFEPSVPIEFSEEEIKAPWVRLRPSVASSFQLSFAQVTPRRFFKPSFISDIIK